MMSCLKTLRPGDIVCQWFRGVDEPEMALVAEVREREFSLLVRHDALLLEEMIDIFDEMMRPEVRTIQIQRREMHGGEEMASLARQLFQELRRREAL